MAEECGEEQENMQSGNCGADPIEAFVLGGAAAARTIQALDGAGCVSCRLSALQGIVETTLLLALRRGTTEAMLTEAVKNVVRVANETKP